MNTIVKNTLRSTILKYPPLTTNRSLGIKNNYYLGSSKKDLQQQQSLIRQQLSQILTKQIQSQSTNLYNHSKYQQLLQIINWNIKHEQQKSVLQLNKSTQTHTFTAFVTIKPPIEMTAENKLHRVQQKQLQIQILQEQLKKKHQQSIKKHIEQLKNYLQSNPFDEPFSLITVFVQKLKPKSKYLCIEYLANSQHVQIEQMSMMSKIVPNKIQRLQQCHQYDGRPIGSWDMEKRQMLFLLTQTEYQLRKQVIQTIFQLTCCYQQKQYINWLNNFNSML